jgi:diguanylate cyclase (GGDEF)-like protein
MDDNAKTNGLLPGEMVDPELIESLLALTACGSPAALSESLRETLNHRLRPESISIYEIEYDDDPQTRKGGLLSGVRLCAVGKPAATVPLSKHPLIMEAIHRRQPILNQPANAAHQYAYPMSGRNVVTHVLHVTADEIGESAVALIDVLWQMWQHLYRLMETNELDKLTGLLNRVAFDNRLTDIFSSARTLRRETDGEGQVLAVIDIDHFKKVNDKYGHLYGDEVLVQLARLMSTCFRGRDLVFRYGGEEFLVILRRCTMANGIRVMDRFRKKAANYHYPQIGSMTVSIGITEITHGDLPTSILDRADKALYYSKEHGRNQVNVYEHLVDSGKLPGQPSSPDDVELF